MSCRGLSLIGVFNVELILLRLVVTKQSAGIGIGFDPHHLIYYLPGFIWRSIPPFTLIRRIGEVSWGRHTLVIITACDITLDQEVGKKVCRIDDKASRKDPAAVGRDT